MDEEHSTEGNLSSELKLLGDNLRETLKAVWDSEERKKVHNEIESGISELGDALRQASNDFDASEVGQDIKSGVQDVRQRLESGEVETRLREDLLSALKSINNELGAVQAKWTAGSQTEASETEVEVESPDPQEGEDV